MSEANCKAAARPRASAESAQSLFSRVEHVERVEMFMLAARPHSSIIYSRSSTEGSDTLGHEVHPAQTILSNCRHIVSFPNNMKMLQFLKFHSCIVKWLR